MSQTLYTFRHQDGTTKMKWFESGRAPTTLKVGRKTLTRSDVQRKHGDAPGGHLPSCWPMVDRFSMTCLPSQVEEFERRYREKGVKVRHRIINNMACPVFEDNGHRNRALAARDFVDLDGCYGQRTQGRAHDAERDGTRND